MPPRGARGNRVFHEGKPLNGACFRNSDKLGVMAQSIKRTAKIDALIVHHTVTPQMWDKTKTMNNLNTSPMAYDGKSPYTYVGGHNWSAIGRPDDTVGYQSGSSKVTNQQSMGVVLAGNFNNDTPTEFQEKWLGETLKMLMKKYNVPRSRIFIHKQVRDEATACPGAKITQSFITKILNTSSMPSDNLSDHIVDGMPADQRITALKEQVGRYKDEIRKRDDIINHPDEGIGALKSKIEELEKQIEQGGDNSEAAQQLAKAKAAYQALGEALT